MFSKFLLIISSSAQLNAGFQPPVGQGGFPQTCKLKKNGRRLGVLNGGFITADIGNTTQIKDKERSDKVDHRGPQLGAWVPVGSASSLSGLTPFRVEIMGQDFVVWDSAASETTTRATNHENRNNNKKRWSVLIDSCPHRLAPLSLGRIDPKTQCLECPYHGWQFHTNGSLSHLPQLDTENQQQSLSSLRDKGSAKSFQVHVTGDLIWAFLPSSVHGESFPQSLLPEDYFPGLASDMERGATYFSYEIPASMDIVVENGLDPSHFPFAHHAVISDRSDASPLPSMQTVAFNFTHLDVYVSYMRKGKPRERLYSFQRPFLLCTQERDKKENVWKQASKFFVVPIREGRCRIITSVPKLTKKWFPIWLFHTFVSRLFRGDLFLHDCERARQNSGTYFQPTSADESARAWQRWHAKFGMAQAPSHTFAKASLSNLTPRLSRRDQEDQWLTHTYSCSKCRTALRRARMLRIGSGPSGILLGAFLQSKRINCPILAVLVVCVGLVTSWIAHKIERFHEGTIRPSDATDRGWSMYQ